MAQITYEYGDRSIIHGVLTRGKVDLNAAAAKDSDATVEVDLNPATGEAKFKITVTTETLPRELVAEILASANLGAVTSI